MASLILHGARHSAEIVISDETGQPVVECQDCPWRGEYDDLRAAIEYAPDHVDQLRD